MMTLFYAHKYVRDIPSNIRVSKVILRTVLAVSSTKLFKELSLSSSTMTCPTSEVPEADEMPSALNILTELPLEIKNNNKVVENEVEEFESKWLTYLRGIVFYLHLFPTCSFEQIWKVWIK